MFVSGGSEKELGGGGSLVPYIVSLDSSFKGRKGTEYLNFGDGLVDSLSQDFVPGFPPPPPHLREGCICFPSCVGP